MAKKETVTAKQVMALAADNKKSGKVAAPKAPSAPTTRKATSVETGFIHLLTDKNPKRAQSAPYFACYVENMSTAEYASAVEALVASGKVTRKITANACLSWDKAHGYVQVLPQPYVAPKAAKK